VVQAQAKQKIDYASRKGKQMIIGFIEGKTYVKMKKPGKTKSLVGKGLFFL
jgi:hypothetical protein